VIVQEFDAAIRPLALELDEGEGLAR